VGVVTAPRKAPRVPPHRVFALGERRVLVILVSPDGDVQNRVIFTARTTARRNWSRPPTTSTATTAGLTIDEVRERLKHEVDQPCAARSRR
jgi:heat-inducible transcriptional repressor